MLVVYVVASLVYLFLNHGASLGLPWTARELVLYVGFGQAEWHLWFLVALAQTTILYWVMRKFQVPPSGLVLCSASLLLVANLALFQQHSGWRLLTYFSFVDWFVFYAVGAWYSVEDAGRRCAPLRPELKRWLALPSILAYVALGLTAAYEHTLSLSRVAWFILTLLLVIESLAQATRRGLMVPPVLARFGSDTMPVYLVHMVPVRIAEASGYLEGDSLLLIAAQVIVVLAVTIVLAGLPRWLLHVLRGLSVREFN